MGRLVFVGLGLWDADDITLRARRVLADADEVIAEFYTSRLFGSSREDLAKAIGRPFEVWPRAQVESGQEALLERAAKGTVAFVTAGDALTATTHQELRREALARGIEVQVVHGVSIKTAASGLLGLSDYKFGRTTTLVFPEPNFFPTSPVDVVVENRARGLHTLVLLDIRAEEERFMSAAEGAAILERLVRIRLEGDDHLEPGLIATDMPVCVVARAGSPEPLVTAGPVAELVERDFGPPLHCLVVPGRLTEEEAGILSATTGFTFTA